MQISVSRSGKSVDPWKHVLFHTVDVRGEALLNHILGSVWSPIVWQGGVRKNQNFLAACAIALDFDSGDWTLDDTIELLKDSGWVSIVGTTKSHQKEKLSSSGVVTPACDRYRVLLALDKPITDPVRYKLQMADIMKRWPVDKSCKDQGRFFFPCKDIVYRSASGSASNLVYFPQLSDEEYKLGLDILIASAHNAQNRVKKTIDMSMLPPWITKVLTFGCESGRRHHTSYRVAAELYKFGWDEQTIIAHLLDTNIKEIGTNDVTRCVKNGIVGVIESDL